MSKFELENRYLTFKLSDIALLSESDWTQLMKVVSIIDLSRTQRGKPPLECVVVEKDWPEYEPVIKMIEARVNNS